MSDSTPVSQQSRFARLKTAVRDQIDISQAMARAAQQGKSSPYHYIKPWIQKAAGVGEPELAPTPYKVLYTRGTMRLLHYEPTVRKHLTPILFVYSLINRYYILDFLPGRSLIEYMVKQGFDVYAIDWGIPGALEQRMTWDDYLGGFLRNAVRWTLRKSGAPDLSLYGYCMGGTMALAYASMYPEGIRNFIAQATPVDFSEGGIFREWTRPERFNVDALVDAFGNVPIDLMESGFSMMAPVQRMTKWLEVFRRIDDPDFVTTFLAMEHWASDNIPFPGEVYRQYIRDCYQTNAFSQGSMRVGDKVVDLSRIACPILSVLAENDVIAPAKSSEALERLVSSSDKTTFRFKAGHIGLSTSSKGRKDFWPKIAGWIGAHSQPWPTS